jgi:hypothetical protein
MFKALSRLFAGKPKKAPRLSIPVAGAAAASVKSSPVPAAAAPPSAKAKWEADAAQGLSRHASPEELAGLTADMTPEQIAERLAKLYQRHNRAASSLDPQLRDEAEFMLETLAGLREKYLR